MNTIKTSEVERLSDTKFDKFKVRLQNAAFAARKKNRRMVDQTCGAAWLVVAVPRFYMETRKGMKN